MLKKRTNYLVCNIEGTVIDLLDPIGDVEV